MWLCCPQMTLQARMLWTHLFLFTGENPTTEMRKWVLALNPHSLIIVQNLFSLTFKTDPLG